LIQDSKESLSREFIQEKEKYEFDSKAKSQKIESLVEQNKKLQKDMEYIPICNRKRYGPKIEGH
jgi:phage shock protein A